MKHNAKDKLANSANYGQLLHCQLNNQWKSLPPATECPDENQQLRKQVQKTKNTFTFTLLLLLIIMECIQMNDLCSHFQIMHLSTRLEFWKKNNR